MLKLSLPAQQALLFVKLKKSEKRRFQILESVSGSLPTVSPYLGFSGVAQADTNLSLNLPTFEAMQIQIQPACHPCANGLIALSRQYRGSTRISCCFSSLRVFQKLLRELQLEAGVPAADCAAAFQAYSAKWGTRTSLMKVCVIVPSHMS